MNELLAMLGLNFGAHVPVQLIPVIIEVGRDLADGNTHLSERSRADLGEAIEQCKRGEL
ncbi:hypothetical protein [Deinococcus ruber]|uniref:Uncharacterized protein n=1 Tax=Deinococcus ruber TaxID=1848197 RepID=A0A918F8I0_9DEIO|nr:hypothetical protein [Deinococcus ruber]GGR18960.1 hypothetical protein GCM10008957_34530 [Deinococcus ruber]